MISPLARNSKYVSLIFGAISAFPALCQGRVRLNIRIGFLIVFVSSQRLPEYSISGTMITLIVVSDIDIVEIKLGIFL